MGILRLSFRFFCTLLRAETKSCMTCNIPPAITHGFVGCNISCAHAQVNVKGFNNVRVVVKTFSFAELKEKIRSAQHNDEAAIS